MFVKEHYFHMITSSLLKVKADSNTRKWYLKFLKKKKDNLNCKHARPPLLESTQNKGNSSWPLRAKYFQALGAYPSASTFYQSCLYFYIFHICAFSWVFYPYTWILSPCAPRAPRAKKKKKKKKKKTIILACPQYWYSSFKFFTHKKNSDPYERFHMQHVWIFFQVQHANVS